MFRATSYCTVVLTILLTLPARAEEAPVDLIRGEVNQDGRFEIFSVNSHGMLFHRWQNPAHLRWSSWAPNLFGNITDIDTVKAADGRMFAFVITGGTLAIRSQMSANEGWSEQTPRLGHDLLRIEATRNTDGRLEAFVLGSDKRIYSFAQNSNTSGVSVGDWTTRALEGQGSRDIAASYDGAGRIVVFALRDDGKVYFRKQAIPNGSFEPWSSLEGIDLQRISAARHSSGSLTLFALGGDGALYSRTQNFPQEAWREWVKVFDSPVTDWSATNDDAGLLQVAALRSPEVRIRAQAREGYFPWISRLQVPQTGRRILQSRLGESPLDPFILKDEPIQSISLVRRENGDLRLFVINDAGAVYTVEQPFDRRTSGTWAGKEWTWLGSPAFSANEPDVVAQLESCISRILDADRATQVYRIINEQLPARIAAGTAGTPFASLAQNVSVALACVPNGPDRWRETLAIWLGHQATPEILHTQTVVEEGFTFAYRINANALRRMVDHVWESIPKALVVEGRTIHLKNKVLQFISNQRPTNDQIRLTVNGSLSEFGQDIGLQARATATFSIADAFPLSSIDSFEPTCELDVELEGTGIAGDIAHIVLDAVGDLLGFSMNDAEAEVLGITKPVCQLTKAILPSLLLPRVTPDAPLQTLAVNYNEIRVDGEGLTAFAGVPPLPRDRAPVVDWTPIEDSIKVIENPSSKEYSFGVKAVTQDMTANLLYGWYFDYPNNDASVPVRMVVKNEAGDTQYYQSSDASRLYFTFYVPNHIDWATVNLGSLILRVRDSDNQFAEVNRPLKQ